MQEELSEKLIARLQNKRQALNMVLSQVDVVQLTIDILRGHPVPFFARNARGDFVPTKQLVGDQARVNLLTFFLEKMMNAPAGKSETPNDFAALVVNAAKRHEGQKP